MKVFETAHDKEIYRLKNECKLKVASISYASKSVIEELKKDAEKLKKALEEIKNSFWAVNHPSYDIANKALKEIEQ